MKKNTEITVLSETVRVQRIAQEDFISLTDIAKFRNPDAPADIIKNWLRSRSTIDLLGLWEKLNNPDFAFEFASWVSVEFKLYLIKEFQRLQEAEQKQLGWDVKRNLTKINYRIHTDAIQANLIPPELTGKQVSLIYASEADVLNMGVSNAVSRYVSHFKETGQQKNGSIKDLLQT